MAGDLHRWISTDGNGDWILATSWSTGISPGVRSTGTLTASAIPVDNDTVTIAGVVYTFKDVLGSAFDVKIAANVTLTMANMTLAINASGVAGTNYGTGTTKSTTVTAVDGASDDVDCTSLFIGSATIIATTEVSATLSWSADTLTGGVQNWDTTDRVVFDGVTSNEDVKANLNMRGLAIQKLTTLSGYSGDIGSSGDPLLISSSPASIKNDPWLIQGSGTVFMEGIDIPVSADGIENLIVDSINNENALTVGGVIRRGFVKAGHVTVSSSATLSDSVGVWATVGPSAVLVLEAGTGPNLVYVGDGICDNSRSRDLNATSFLWIIVGPRGKLIQSRTPDLNAQGAIVNCGGEIVFDVDIDDAFSGNLFLFEGTNDFSAPFDHSAGTMTIIIGPRARVNLGFIETDPNLAVDLRPALPVSCS